MTLSNENVEWYAKLAAQQMVTTYVPQARNLGLTIEDIKNIIRRTAQVAVEIINKQPS